MGVTYYSLVSTGRVFQPTFSLDLNSFNGQLTLNPSPAQRAAVCNESRFLSGSLATCQQTPFDVFLDDRLLSLERLTTSGVDFAFQYAVGDWKARIDAAYLLSYRGVGPNGAILEELNTTNNPVDLRVRATAARAFGPLTISGSVNYTDRYWDTTSLPQRRIGSWTTFDLSATYSAAATSALHGLELILGVRNLADRPPPFVNNGLFQAGWDPANGGNEEGRLVSGQIRFKW
jgi:hypothetical protein